MNAPTSTNLDERFFDRASLFVLLTVVVLLGLGYAGAIGGTFIWDDDYYVTANTQLLDLDGLKTIWFGIFNGPTDYPLPQYYPLVHTTFWIEHHLWGDYAPGYRAVNLLLHATSSWMVFLILRRLGIAGAALAAMLFAIHPLHVESVAWVTERKNVLSATLALASFLSLLTWSGLADRDVSPKRRRIAYVIGLMLFVMALCAKSVVASLPAVFIITYWWRRGRLTVDQWLAMTPFFVIGAAYGMLTAYMEVHRVGASGADWIFADSTAGELGARLQIASRAVAFYLSKLLAPYPLMFNYPRWKIDPTDPLRYAWLILLLSASAVLFAFRRRCGWTPLVVLALFVIMLFPALGFSNVYPMRFSFVADHFCYLAGIPCLSALAYGITRVLDRLSSQWIKPVGVGALLIAMTGLTFVHARSFHDPVALWRTTLRHNPRSWLATSNLGLFLLKQGQLDEAERLFNETLSDLKPDFYQSRQHLAEIDRLRGHVDSARRRLLELVNIEPSYGDGWLALAQLEDRAGNLPEALAAYKQAVLNLAARVPARLWYAQALLKAVSNESDPSRADEMTGRAGRLIDEAIRSDPRNVDARVVKSQFQLRTGQLDQAYQSLLNALELAPDRADVLNTLAVIDIQTGRLDTAEARFTRLLKVQPDYADAMVNWAVLKKRRGDVEGAYRLLNNALRIQPNHALAKRKLNEWQSEK